MAARASAFGARRHGREVADDEQQQPDAEERHDARQRARVAEVDEEQLRDDDDHQRGADDPDRAPRAARADDHRRETRDTPDDRQRALERRRLREAVDVVGNAGPVVHGARDGHRDEEPDAAAATAGRARRTGERRVVPPTTASQWSSASTTSTLASSSGFDERHVRQRRRDAGRADVERHGRRRRSASTAPQPTCA